MIVRYFASAKAAAGVDEDRVDAATLQAALAVVRSRHDDRLGRVLEVCSFLVDGDPVGARDHADVTLVESSVVDVLPPFAGG